MDVCLAPYFVASGKIRGVMLECDMKVPGESQRTEDEQCSRFQTEFETPSLLNVSRL